MTKEEIQIEQGTSLATTNDLVCTVHDACRTCSFKELQLLPDICQTTGFRLIKHCVETDASNNLVEERYLNEACYMYNGTEDYSQWNETQRAIYAEPGTQPTSILSFMLVMAIFAVIVTVMLNKRKERILHEIYSKISIVDR